ncbi:MAG TPA: hypothetical protein VGI81_17200 [Tepidisphaeraceae bacterium]
MRSDASEWPGKDVSWFRTFIAPGVQAGALGIATHVVPDAQLDAEADALARRLASGPTRSYAATRTLLKAWSSGGVAAADAVMLHAAMDLHNGCDAQRGFASKAKAIEAGVEPASVHPR